MQMLGLSRSREEQRLDLNYIPLAREPIGAEVFPLASGR
jgi:hypothetical protein